MRRDSDQKFHCRARCILGILQCTLSMNTIGIRKTNTLWWLDLSRNLPIGSHESSNLSEAASDPRFLMVSKSTSISSNGLGRQRGWLLYNFLWKDKGLLLACKSRRMSFKFGTYLFMVDLKLYLETNDNIYLETHNAQINNKVNPYDDMKLQFTSVNRVSFFNIYVRCCTAAWQCHNFTCKMNLKEIQLDWWENSWWSYDVTSTGIWKKMP